MREIVHIQFGRCGNQIGESFWRLISQEHGIDLAGEPVLNDDVLVAQRCVFFGELSSGRYYARSILVDLEAESVNEITSGPASKMFPPNNVISSWQSGSARFFAKGHYTEGAELCDTILDSVRKEVECTDCLQGFQFAHSIGGGVGSGTTTLVISKIREEFPDRIFTTFTVAPSPKTSSSVIEPYNATLAIHQLVENADLSIVLDNEALFNICTNKLKISTPSFRDLNRIISCSMSNATSSLRFPGALNSDLRKLAMNLFPYYRMHFITPSFSPMTDPRFIPDLPLMLFDLFDSSNQLVSCDVRKGHFISGAVTVRGQDQQLEVENILKNFRNKYSSNFVEWVPDHLKSSSCPVAPPDHPVMCSLLSNNTSIKSLFENISSQFQALFRRKAYLYGLSGEGMDEMEFSEADSNLQDLIAEYAQMNVTAEE